MTLLHRCRFVEWRPRAINALEMSPPGTRPILAVARQNGDLELFDASQNWAVTCIPTGGIIGRTIESLVWLRPINNNTEYTTLDYNETTKYSICEAKVLEWKEAIKLHYGRLFTAGHDGMIVEWDLNTLLPKRHLHVAGGGIWCMTSSPDEKLLALGCENGTIKLVSVRQFEVVKTISVSLPNEFKLLSIAWSSSNPSLLAVGTSNSFIVIFDVNNARVFHRLELDVREQRQTMVWSLKFAGSSLVSGNSLGQVQFWNPTIGTLLTTNKMPNANVFTISVDSSGNRVWSSSSDGRTFIFGLNGPDDAPTWIPLEKLSIHRHDVRASTCGFIPVDIIDGKVCLMEVFVSGGVGTNIAIFRADNVTKRRVRYLSPLPQHQIVRLARTARLIAANLGDSIGIWCLGAAHPEEAKLSLPGRNVLQIKVPNRESLWSFDLSSNGKLLVYCTRSAFRMYHLEWRKDVEGLISDIEVTKMDIAERFIPEGYIAQAVTFSPDSQYLAVAISSKQKRSSRLMVARIGGSSLSTEWEHNLSTFAIKDIRWSSNWIVAHNVGNTVYAINNVSNENIKAFDTFDSQVTALRITDSGILYVVTAKKTITLYDLTRGDGQSSNSVSIREEPAWRKSPEIVTNIVKPSFTTETQKLCLCCENYIVAINPSGVSASLDSPKKRPKIFEIEKKKSKTPGRRQSKAEKAKALRAPSATIEKTCADFGSQMKIHSKFSGILYFDYLSADEAVLVERPWEDIQNTLPPAQDRKEYGGF